jgi:hypothetical protein
MDPDPAKKKLGPRSVTLRWHLFSRNHQNDCVDACPVESPDWPSKIESWLLQRRLSTAQGMPRIWRYS